MSVFASATPRRPRGTRTTRSTLVAAAAGALVAPMMLAGPAAAESADGVRVTLDELARSQGAPAASARTSRIPLAAAAAAMGSRISGNAVVGSGRSAASYLCTTQFPNRSANDVVGTRGNTEDVLELGAVTTNNRSNRINGNRAVTSRAAAADIELGGGAVVIEGLTSFSRVIDTPRGFQLRSKVDIAALEIAGQRIPINLGSGKQTLPVPGLGTLTFNDVRRVNRKNKGLVRTSALVADFADGTKVQLVRSKARFDRQPDGVFRGGAWGSEIDVAGILGSGKTALVPMPCAGTNGQLNTNDTVEAGLPGVLDAGVQESAVRTRTYRNGNGEGTAFNRVAEVSLGGGALEIAALESFALVVRAPGGKVVRKRSFSTIGSITAGGQTFEAPDPGQSLEIPGVATLTAGLVQEQRRGVKVVALQVELLDGQGATVDLGVSRVFARR
ncbi:hypothetical protein KLP28_14135 [Nocardioidaceae bacterium]|nr:hypothetical protein KLP28_14135 [Nocardioidaceae bacterium]